MKYTLCILTIICFLTSCNKNDTVKIKIIGTSDIHGAFLNYDLIKNYKTKNSLSKVYEYVSKQRENKEQEVILLDNGDILQGTPMVYYSNFIDTASVHITAQIMNFMKYDAATVGNHDIEPGHKVYDKVNKELNFPWLAANAVNKKGKPYFKPYTIIKKKGVKIAILGMITPAIPKWLPEKIWSGITFNPILESTEKWVSEIQKKENPDFIVCLLHSGMGDGEKNTSNEPLDQAALLVAKEVKGVDLVICGHDHRKALRTIKNKYDEEVTIINPQNGARYVADIEIDFTKQDGNKYTHTLKAKLVSMADIEASKTFEHKFNSYNEKVVKFVSREIGQFTKTIKSEDALFGDSAFTDLIHTIQLELTGADISFTAPLAFKSEIKAGKLFVRDMFKLYKYENLLYTMELTGAEIKGFLEHSISIWFNKMENDNDNLLLFKENSDRLENPYFNFDSAAGIIYQVNLKNENGNRVKILKMQNGDTFDMKKTYRVAINSYRGNGGGDHLTKGAGIAKADLAKRIVNATEKDMRFFMMKWIEKNKVISPTCDSNWSLKPNTWWVKAKKKDYNTIFGRK